MRRSGSARLPTAFGDFTITVYRDEDLKEHLAVRMGDLNGPPPLVRIHSECMTGDVFRSVRCDCGEQLAAALGNISREGRGLLLYLRQEGRGIGLDNKIRAYGLQDRGMDTVEANLHLGLPIDGRSYTHAAAILKDQGIHSVRLATNNLEKVKALEACGIHVSERVDHYVQPRPENYAYLLTKAVKMGHLLDPLPPATRNDAGIVQQLRDRLSQTEAHAGQARALSVTLSYAQSLDGSIAGEPDKPLQLSNPQSRALVHELRSLHDAILVGINTVLSDDPQLTVRLVAGKNPQPVVLDSRLRLPLGCKLLCPPCIPPIIATTVEASVRQEKLLRAAGAEVVRLPSNRNGSIDLRALLKRLHVMGIRSLMVEGGARVITEFLTCQLVDRMIITIAPRLVGGLNALKSSSPNAWVSGQPRLVNVRHESFAGDLVVFAEVEKPDSNQFIPERGRPSSWGAYAELPQAPNAEQHPDAAASSPFADPT